MPRRPRPVHRIALAILVLAVAGCGGGGGGGGSAPAPAAAPTTQVLGSRALPGCTVTVERVLASAPGTWTFRIAVSPSDTAITSVQARLGSQAAADGYVTAAPVSGRPGVFEIATAKPGTADPAHRSWVRIVFADGNVVESGAHDFAVGAVD